MSLGIGDFQRPCHALLLTESRSSQLDNFLIVYQHTGLERNIHRIQRLEIDLMMHGECQQPTTSVPSWSALPNVVPHGQGKFSRASRLGWPRVVAG
jgi:hypothetical protein